MSVVTIILLAALVVVLCALAGSALYARDSRHVQSDRRTRQRRL